MKTILSYALVIAMAGFAKAASDLPKVASLKEGEQIVVNMTLYGYTTTKADFTFGAEGVSIQSEKARGELVLTKEDRLMVDEYLNSMMRGEPRVAAQEGYDFSISHSEGGRKQSWKFSPVDVAESERPVLSLHELQSRLEQQLKEFEFEDPSDGYFSAYLMTRRAGELENSGDRAGALVIARKALEWFHVVKKRFPGWKTGMVDGRIKIAQEAVDRLSAPQSR